MDKFLFRRQDPDTQQQASRVLAGWQILHGILNWLAALIRFPTEEEQQNAGIFTGDRHYK